MSYKTECPRCGGNDFYVTPSNGVGYCFHCTYFERDGDKKSEDTALECAVPVIRSLYKKLTDYYHSCITPKVREYLHTRGYTDVMIEELKLGYIPDENRSDIDTTLGRDSGLYAGGKAVLGNRISFPYLADNTVVDIRGRAMDKEDPIRYKSPLGSAHLRGADYPYNYKDSQTDHIITEGEIKAAIASQHEIPCVAVPGIVSWRPKLSGVRKQTIVFDSTRNRSTREITYRAIDKLAHRLYNPHVAMLPLRGNDKMDIDSFIIAYGAEEFRTIINSALPYEDWAKIQRRKNVH